MSMRTLPFALIGIDKDDIVSVSFQNEFNDCKNSFITMNEASFSSFLEVDRDSPNTSFSGAVFANSFESSSHSYIDCLNTTAKDTALCDTFCFLKDGIFAANTSYFALQSMFCYYNYSLAGQNVLILGTNHLAKVCSTLAASKGASKVTCISVDALPSNFSSIVNDVTCLINATSLEDFPFTLKVFSKLNGVFDLTYANVTSNLVGDALSRKILSGGGLPRIISQLCFVSCLFDEISKDPNISFDSLNQFFLKLFDSVDLKKRIDNATKASLFKQCNIVIVGMPGSRKSSFGKALSQSINRPFYDVDAEIEKSLRITIPNIISTKGEPYYRRIESSAISQITNLPELSVIAVGDGVVLRKENLINLKKNGVLVFLDTPLNCLDISEQALSKADLNILYSRRIGTYKAISDLTLFTVGSDDFTLLCSEFHSHFLLG